MKNVRHIETLVNEIAWRKENIVKATSLILKEAISKSALNDNSILLSLNSEYNEYLTEFDLLTQLEDFYSNII